MPERSPYAVGVIHGDGIGREVVGSALRVCRAALELCGARVEWTELPGGKDAIEATGLALPPESLRTLERCDGLILGPVDHAAYPRYRDGRRQNPSGELRRRFDLYANIRPARTYPGVPAAVADTDLVIVRENTEGFYSDRNMASGNGEFSPTPDVALSVGVFTRAGVGRVTRLAFALAAQRRRHLTVVHKANVLPDTTGMYLRSARELAPAHPDVAWDDLHVDAMAAALVRRAPSFDVIVTENLFGDILSDLAGELVGSLGLAGSLNAGDRYAMAQAAHGSAPDIAGQDIANPVSEIASAAMLLDWLGQRHDDKGLTAAGGAIRTAVAGALAAAPTRDAGGSATTTEFTDTVIGLLDGAGR